MRKHPLPVVYSCSGCSSAAQMTNHVALRLDRRGLAEMSCIAGVGGKVPALVRVAQSGRDLLVLDGCPLRCAQKCLEQHGITPRWHFVLSDFDIQRKLHRDFDPSEADRVFEIVVAVTGLDSVAEVSSGTRST